jgi:general secretion pathway protein I
MRRGFTLIEMLVATLIMAVAVTGGLSALYTSMRNADRVSDHDRAAMLARRKMDELLVIKRLPRLGILEGSFDGSSGWRARLTTFETPPNPAPGNHIIDRVELEIWWMAGTQRRTFSLEGFRRTLLTQEDMAAGALSMR